MNTTAESDEKGSISPDLLAILCCPETKQSLKPLTPEAVRNLNQLINKGKLKNRGGEIITESIDGGLIREDTQMVFAIRDQIPIMLIEEGIPVTPEHLASG